MTPLSGQKDLTTLINLFIEGLIGSISTIIEPEKPSNLQFKGRKDWSNLPLRKSLALIIVSMIRL